MATAVPVTDRTQSRIRHMGDDGTLPSRLADKRTRMYRTSAVVRDAYRNGRLLLPDVLRTASGQRLDETDLAHALTTHQAGAWYTLSRRGFMPPDWPSWAAWYAGDEERARALLAEEQYQYGEEARSLTARGLTRRRLWCSDQPLNVFGQYQALHLQLLADAGTHVRVLPGRKLAHLEARGPLPDLEALPDAVYVRRYTAIGTRDGAARISDPGLVSATRDLAHWLYTSHASLLAVAQEPSTAMTPLEPATPRPAYATPCCPTGTT